jgi:hypothetical protein
MNLARRTANASAEKAPAQATSAEAGSYTSETILRQAEERLRTLLEISRAKDPSTIGFRLRLVAPFRELLTSGHPKLKA